MNSVSRLFPLLSIKVVQTLLKAKRSSGKPFLTESSSCGEYSARNGLPLDLFAFRRVCTNLMDSNENKRLIIFLKAIMLPLPMQSNYHILYIYIFLDLHLMNYIRTVLSQVILPFLYFS